jgi:hypothetical protein
VVSEAPRLSRRDVLSGAAAVGVGAAIAPGAARARDRGSGRFFSVAVGRLAAGTSAAIAPGRRFVLVGIQWAEPAAAQIELRARHRGAGWSPWAQGSVRGHQPDIPGAGETQSGEPVWFGPADEVQLRSSGVADGVRLHFVAADADVGLGPGVTGGVMRRHVTDAPYQLVDVNLSAGPGQPPIIARAAWASTRHRPASGPYYGSIDLRWTRLSRGMSKFLLFMVVAGAGVGRPSRRQRRLSL